MKLNIEREALLEPLQKVIGVVERKQTLPILSNILLNVKNNTIFVTGTDLEVELVGHSDAAKQAAEDTSFTLPGRKLLDICKALPDGAPIELYEDKGRVVLSSGKSRFTLSTLPAADFPNIEGQDSQISFTLEQQDLARLLQFSSFAMAQQDVRYYLNGLLLEVDPDKISAVATDGHRLAMVTIDADVDSSQRQQIIIPRKGVLELQRLLGQSEEPVTISISSNYIRVNTNSYSFTSKLIEGKFPDYRRVLPNKIDKNISINKAELKQALNRTAILCNEKFRGLRFEFRPNLLRIMANNPEQEVAEEELVIQYDKEDLDIGFNVNYLLDVLNTITADDVVLGFSDSNSSLLVEEKNAAGLCMYVIMPMRL